jgi:hypothetical protein
MKKLIMLGIFSMVLVGCSSSSDYIMVENKDENYGLYEIDSNKKPAFTYDAYTKVESFGYLVQKKNDYGFIDMTGEEIIPLGKYPKLEVIDEMIIAYDKKDKETIFTMDGEELYKEDKNTTITISDLPIVSQDKKYTVLHMDGETYFQSSSKITYVSVLDMEYTLIGYKDTVDIINNATEVATKIKLKGTYSCLATQADTGYLLYDETATKIAFITKDDKVGFTLEQQVDDLYFDANKNIVAVQGNTLYLLSNKGDKTTVGSYYQDSKNYVKKNEQYIYGPHTFYANGKEVSVDGIQLDPLASFTKQDVFPVFVREKGYQFYSFKGKPAFDTVYRKATAFDTHGRSIVSEEGETYYLINAENKKVSKEYKKIEYVGKNFYAGYTTDNRYDVIDADGNVVLDTYFMGNKDIVIYKDYVFGIFSKSGKAYVYDMTSLELIFSCEGNIVFDQDGYFINKGTDYYNEKGEKIYSR